MDMNEQTIPEHEGLPQRVSEARRTYSAAFLNIAIFWAISVLLQFILPRILPENAPKYLSAVCTFGPMYLVAFPVYVLLSKKLPASQPETHRMNAGQILAAFPCCECIGVAGNFIGVLINLILGLLLGFRTDSTALVEGLLGEGAWVYVIAAVCCAPVIEEMMFRKILIDRIRKYGEIPAILLSGLLFGLFHGNFTQFFYASGLGLLFAWIYIRTGKIIHTIVLHCLVNFWGSALPMALLHSVGKDTVRTLLVDRDITVLMENPGKFLPFVILIVVNYSLALAGLILILLNRKRIQVQPAEEELPKHKRFPAAVCNAGFILLFIACVSEFVMQIIQGMK